MPSGRESVRPLAQSRPKAEFMKALGLDANDPAHQQVYKMMMAEAETSRAAINFDRDALLPHLKDDPTVQPPFSIIQINETVRRREIIAIYDKASPTTRKYYDVAQDPMTRENWAIKWMIWHVFKSRDARLKPAYKYAVLQALTEHMAKVEHTTMQPWPQHNAGPSSTPARLPFDPVRDS